MKIDSFEKKRASNIIWNASDDYSFEPDIMVYDEDGKADIYYNYIIGAVHKFYDYKLLRNFFEDLEEDSLNEYLQELAWIGLENSTYEKSKNERPVLESLRISYAKKLLSKCNAASENYIIDEIKAAHFRKVLGEEPKMTALASEILKDIEFDGSMDTEQIIYNMNQIIKKYFGLGLISVHYGEKPKPKRHRIIFPKLFSRITAAYFLDINSKKKEHKLNKLILNRLKLKELRETNQRKYIQNCYGVSIFPEPETKALEKSLCFGNHKNCHIHFTRGEFDNSLSINIDVVYHKNTALKQREKNREHYRKNIARNNNSISKLANIIKNTMADNLESYSIRSEAGKLMAEKVWRSSCLNDNKVFIKNIKDDICGLSVDIMLDASSSQINRQEIIAEEGYIIAESLTICNIPVRVYSFCSERNYTIINLFRDYNEVNKNESIFNYYSAGCNRDGLAIRTALHMMKNNTCEHKILIILSDGLPNDMTGIPVSKFKYTDYIGESSINDTVAEVRKGIQKGVPILCVFTGPDKNISYIKKIYGHNFAYIRSLDRFADAVGVLLQNEMNSFS